MSTEQTPVPADKPTSSNPLLDPALERAEVPEVLDFLKENGMSILIGVGLAVVVFVGISAFRNFKKTQEATASSMLFQSQSAEQFQQLVDAYPKTAAAPLAQLSLASGYFDQGQFEMAQNAFATFAQTYPTHSFALAAELGQIQSLEALGRLEEALDGYTKFAEAHKGRYLESAAVFGRGRCLELLGRLTEARAVYEDFMLADPKGRWAGRAEFSLQYVDKLIRAKERGPSAETSPAPAPVLEPLSLSPPVAAPAEGSPLLLQP
jgi:predicted negative regulator of RcsB-dependent stress response